jgi:hypothetical protein
MFLTSTIPLNPKFLSLVFWGVVVERKRAEEEKEGVREPTAQC